MKATEIVKRIDDLGRVVIPKEIRRTMRMTRYISLTHTDMFCDAFIRLAEWAGITVK